VLRPDHRTDQDVLVVDSTMSWRTTIRDSRSSSRVWLTTGTCLTAHGARVAARSADATELELTLTQGRKRQVRLMCRALDLHLVHLHPHSHRTLTDAGLPLGRVALTRRERGRGACGARWAAAPKSAAAKSQRSLVTRVRRATPGRRSRASNNGSKTRRQAAARLALCLDERRAIGGQSVIAGDERVAVFEGVGDEQNDRRGRDGARAERGREAPRAAKLRDFEAVLRSTSGSHCSAGRGKSSFPIDCVMAISHAVTTLTNTS